MSVIGYILCLMLMIQVASADIFDTTEANKLIDYVSKVMECHKVPGLTLGVVKGGGTWVKGFGYRDVENKKPVQSDTLFGIGSITKAFTTTLLSMLIDESNNKYSWTSKLTDILGEDFKLIDGNDETTLKDILSHRTGLNTAVIGLLAGYPANFTRAKAAGLLQYLGSVAPFRDGFIYNNWMYVLAGHIVEVISGKSWEDLLKTRILDPLGMRDTRVIGKTVEVTADNVAKPYVMVGDKLVVSAPEIYNIHPGEPAGAIGSTADDMVRWIQLILNKGNMTNGAILADWKTLKAVFNPYTTIPDVGWSMPEFPIADVKSGYGYGWFISNHAGYKKLWHGGSVTAYNAMLWIFPDLDMGIYANINGPDMAKYARSTFSTVMPYVFDLVMKKQPWLTKATACTFPLPWRAQPPPAMSNNGDVTDNPVTNPAQYVGEYGHRLLGIIHLTLNGTNLHVQMGNYEGLLRTTTKTDVFKMESRGAYAYLYHQEKTFQLFPVAFVRMQAGKFQDIVLYASPTTSDKFERGVKMGQPSDISTTSPKLKVVPCTNSASNNRSILYLGYICSVNMIYVLLFATVV